MQLYRDLFAFPVGYHVEILVLSVVQVIMGKEGVVTEIRVKQNTFEEV